MSAFGDLTILVVENNANMRRMFTAVLNALGTRRVLEAPDVLTGYLHTTCEPVDVVLLDYLLGERNGDEFVTLLRGDVASVNRKTPVIIVTAIPEHPGVAAALEAGAQGILAKPIDPVTLYQAVVQATSPGRDRCAPRDVHHQLTPMDTNTGRTALT